MGRLFDGMTSDIGGSFADRFLAGYDNGRQRRIEDDARSERKQVNALLGRAYADPKQRNSVLPQVAALDAGAAFGAEQQFAASDERLERQRTNLSRLYQSVPAAARPLVAQRYAGDFQRLGMDIASPEFEGITTAYAQAFGPKGSSPSPKVLGPGAALVAPDGRALYRNDFQAPSNGQMVNVPDGQGGTIQMVFDPRTRKLSAPEYPSEAQTAAPTATDWQDAPEGPLQADSAARMVAQIEASQGAPLSPTIKAQIMADLQREGGRVDTGSFNQSGRQASAQPPTYGSTVPARGGLGYKPPNTAGAGPVATLSPEEVASAGFPPGSVVQRKPDGSLSKVFSPTERDANGGRALPAPVVNDLSKDAEKLTTLNQLIAGFQPGFAGNVVGGSVENFAGRLGGERIGVTTPGQSQWWQQYDRLKNVVRNELFGAALTATEQAAFEAADITPNMDAAVITSNLTKQAEIVQRALQRKASVWKSQGYNPDAVINATTVPSGAPVSEMSDEELKKALNL